MEKYSDNDIKNLLLKPATQRRGFELLVREYSEKLYWQVRRIVLLHEDANDVLQNTFIKAWNALGSFHGDSKVFTWVSRIAINESLDFMRKQKTLSIFGGDADEGSIADTLIADDYSDGDATEAQLQQAIASLPDVQRTVFTLRYYDEMKYSEISKLLNTSEGSLKASYHIAVKKISEFFKQRD